MVSRRVGRTVCLVSLAVLTACAPDIPPPQLSFPVKEQDVPAVVAIGPIDTSVVKYEELAISEQVEATMQGTIRDSLVRTQILKEVIILKIATEAGKKLDPEQVLAAARAQNADLLLVGEVKEFSADVPSVFGSQYNVNMRLHAQLFNVHTGAQVWKKTDKVSVRKEGSGIKKQESLDMIVRNVAVPPLVAGLLPPMVDHLQTDYLRAGKTSVAAGGSSVFGGAEMAKIDAELAPPVSTVPSKEHAYAVVVGVEDYRDLPRVDYAKRDAEMVKQYLIHSLGYREQNVVLLLNDRVTKAGLEARFEKWLPKQVGTNAEAEVFVYYGGHGAPDANTNEAFIVPYDGDPSYLDVTAYPLKRLYKSLSDLPAKQITIVMDSCFSGAGGRSVIAKGARPMLIKVENPLVASSNLVVISAAAGNQISSALPEKRHGLFTYFFLKGLQGEADANKDGSVDVEELYAYIRPQVETAARRQNAEQSPQLLPGADLLGERAKVRLIDLKKLP